MRPILTLTLLALVIAPAARAIDLREATFTQVVNSVTVSDPQGAASRAAQVNTKFSTPNVIRTGASSRAELTAADQTVTRIGANTIFSFKPEGRGINLQQGSVLFNSPTGKGGGTIQTAAATASVLGTTILVTTTSNGGFKLLVLEGKAKASLANGRGFTLTAGQMTFILPGMTQAPRVFEFRLSKQNDGSNLLKGFSKPLPAEEKVNEAKKDQEEKIAKGEKTDTGMMLGDANGNEVQVIDPNTVQAFFETKSGDEIERLKKAVTVDQMISASTIDSSNVINFSRPGVLELGLAAIGSPYGLYITGGADKVNMFAAKNLEIYSYTIDLSPYGDADTFAFFGKESLKLLSGSLAVSGFNGGLVFHTDGTLSLSSYLSYNGSSLDIECFNTGGLNLTNTITNSGSISVSNFGGDLTLSSPTLVGSEISLYAAGDINFTGTPILTTSSLFMVAGGNFTMSGTTYNMPGTSVYAFAGNTLSLSAVTLTVSDVVFSAGSDFAGYTTNFYSGGNISLSSGGTFVLSNGTMIAADTVALSAGTVLNVNDMNITGNTVLLDGDVINSSNSSYTASYALFIGASATSVHLNGGTHSAPLINLHGETVTASYATLAASSTASLFAYGSGSLNMTSATVSAPVIELTGPASNLSYNYYTAVDSIDASVSGVLTDNGNNWSTSSTNSTSGKITMTSTGGDITSTNSSFTGQNIKVQAVVGTINLDSGTFTAKKALVINGKTVNITNSTFSSPSNGSATFSGSMAASGSTLSNAIHMTGVSFSTSPNNFNSVSMAAYTIVLTNVDFASGSQVYLTSGISNPGGVPNFGSAIPGRVNFMTGVTYGGLDVNTVGGYASNGSNIHVNP